jgi:chaperone required for assembly of F1-ATPase
MTDFPTAPADMLSDPDPTKRAQIKMKAPLPKRFYSQVTAAEDPEGGYAVCLDGKPVRTPARQKLVLPNFSMAQLVASEWDAQHEVVNPTTMPVTKLVNTAIDGIANDVQAVFEDILRFSSTDLLCYRAESPQRLVEIQAESWDPVIDWLANTHGARFIMAEGVIHQEQPREAIAAFGAVLRRHEGPFTLASLHTVTSLTGSALLALAFAEGFLSGDEIWALAHIDEDWQISQWGEDAEATRRRELRKAELDAACALFLAMGKAAE